MKTIFLIVIISTGYGTSNAKQEFATMAECEQLKKGYDDFKEFGRRVSSKCIEVTK